MKRRGRYPAKYLSLPQIGSPLSIRAFKDEEGHLRIENLGPFTMQKAKKLAYWIYQTFGDRL